MLLVPMFLVLANCDSDIVADAGEPVGDSRAFTAWVPGPTDTCTPDIHNRYVAVGPDGLRYPTWHPPVDPQTGCRFGHEHGRDPRGSDLYDDVGPLVFGLANQQLDVFDPLNPRHEDHVGHKVHWENDMRLDFGGGAGSVLSVTCDILAKLHQGTHSKDAFTNNVHEIIYHIKCTDRTEMHIQMLTAIGEAGEFTVACDRGRSIDAGVPSPRNSPDGGGHRAIPDRSCIESHMLVSSGRSNFEAALHESWETSQNVRTENGHTLASFDPYFQVVFASRFYDATKADLTGRPIEVCYEVTPSGERARGDECEDATAGGTITGLLYNDPRSPFRGDMHFMDVNGNRVSNTDGPEVWYTDPYGRRARTSPFPGSIRQWIARVDNSGRQGHGPVIDRNRVTTGPGVHAPN
ncbi:MAG: hypothetical protein ACRENP_15590 [Longimicrobiales bacterium]